MFKIMNIFSMPYIQIIRYLGRRYRDGYYVREISRNLRIILFGSCAAGEDTMDSDIDIFIESDDKRVVAELHDSYQEKIPRKISPIILDSSEFRNLEAKDRPLFERINMGKVIHEASIHLEPLYSAKATEKKATHA